MLALIATMTVSVHAETSTDVAVGRGRYALELAPGGEHEPPPVVGRGPHLAGAVPTNQWYSSLLFSQWPQPLYALPASYKPTADGFEIDTPVKQVNPAPSREETDIAFPHRRALVVQPLGFKMKSAQLDKVSDWAIDVLCGDGHDALKATLAHGSPFSYFELTQGDVQFSAEQGLSVLPHHAGSDVLAFTALGRPYAVYAPRGAHWQQGDGGAWVLQLPAERRWFTVAALPDASPATIERFARYAYSVITDTQVSWRYDARSSELVTTFTAKTAARQGRDEGTLFGLYPHHWFGNTAEAAALKASPGEYATVRGPLKLVAGHSFETRYRYSGVLPYWPALTGPQATERLKRFLAADTQFGADDLLARTGGTYWEGKGLNRAAQVMDIADQLGDTQRRDDLLAAMKSRFERWFNPDERREHYFHYRRDHGTLIGYPDEFGSAEQLNDHHFHYGYWLFAAAQVALRDPHWAARDQWGGMVEMLAADIASTERAHAKFPRLRHFDLYEGHSWASGTVPFAEGNNQESSSEAINAWAGLILWGEITGNTALRDTGIALYATETQALSHYWFDLHHLVFAPEYQNTEATMVWGSKYVHTTWWTEDPREAHGINWLPLTTASMYLGADPAYLQRSLQAMDAEFARFKARGGEAPADIWQDVLLETLALADPDQALQQWNPEGAVEGGETRTHTWHWMQSLREMGTPALQVTADTPLFGVFERPDHTRTYLAYNAGAKPLAVHFSDGTRLVVPPRQLARSTRGAR